MTKWGLVQEPKTDSIIENSKIFQNHLIVILANSLKKKNHMVTSVEAKKAFDKIQYLFMINTPSILEIKENFLNLIKGIHTKSTSSIILNGAKLNAFPLFGTRQECSHSPLLFSHIGGLSRCEKE